MSEWTEVRRSTPAEEIDEIPDDAYVWACWVNNANISVKIYKTPEKDYIPVRQIEDQIEAWPETNRDEAMEVASSIRDFEDAIEIFSEHIEGIAEMEMDEWDTSERNAIRMGMADAADSRRFICQQAGMDFPDMFDREAVLHRLKIEFMEGLQ